MSLTDYDKIWSYKGGIFEAIQEMMIHSKQVGDAFLNCFSFSMIVGEKKYIPPFLIQLLVEDYTYMRSHDYLKRLKAKAVNSLSNLSTRNSIKAVKAVSRGEVSQAIIA